MNEFKENLKKQYEDYKKNRYEKVVKNPKWDIAKERMKGER